MLQFTAVQTRPFSPRMLLGRLLLVGLGLLIPLLALELGLRWLGLAPPLSPNPAIWTAHPLFGWWHIPYSGGTFHSDYNEFAAEVRINARGLRDREIGYDNPAGALRILSLADSFGEALQVDLAESYHKQLETLLAAELGRPVEVINAGTGGWGTDQEAIFYLAEGFRYRPEIVLLAFFVRNDAVNNYGPLEMARTGGQQQKAFFSLSAGGELIPPDLEGEAAVEAGAEALNSPDAAQPQPEAALLGLADGLWRWSALYRFLLPYLRDVPAVVQRLGPSGILGGEGVVRAGHPTVPVPFFVYREPPDRDFMAAWQLTEGIIAGLRDEVAKRGATLVVMLIAAPEQLDDSVWQATLQRQPAMQPLNWNLELPNQRLTAFLQAAGIPYLDLLPVFRAASGEAGRPPLHFQHDQHWTPAGHRLAAETLFRFLLDEGLVEGNEP